MGHFSEQLSGMNAKLLKLGGVLTLKNRFANAAVTVLILALALHLFYSYTGVYKFMPNRPSSIHFSAQTSRACIALNYYEGNMNFFTPTYLRNLEGKGYTGLEFPVIYYLAAVMYKMFGFHEVYLRVLSLVFFSFGNFMFYLLCNKFTKNRFVSIAIILALISSPVIVFYAANFMPDPPALGLVLAAWFFFFRYLNSRRRRDLNLFFIFTTLATLLKVTAGIALVIIVCLVFLDRFRFFRSQGRDFIFNEKRRMIIFSAISVLIVIAWYAWSSWFPKTKGGNTFLMNTMMLNDWEGFKYVLEHMKNLWLSHYYSTEAYLMMGAVTLVVILGFKLLDRLLFVITLLYALGSIAYFYLFLYQFVYHDYYVIMMLPTLFFLFLTFGDVISKFSHKYFYPIYFIFLFIMFFNLKESFLKTQMKMSERNSSAIYYWTGDFRAYEDLEPKLRKIGIAREDRVISGFDDSDCGSLYLMNQLGVTFGNETTKHVVDSFIQHKNARYLLLNDSAKFRKNYQYDFSGKIIGFHRGIIIYKIK